MNRRRVRMVAAMGIGSLGMALACDRDVVGPDVPPPPPAPRAARLTPLGEGGAPHTAFLLGSPTILVLDASAPSLHSTQTSFYAKVGEQRSGSIYFQNGSGGQGAEYARLTVYASSLHALPDGTLLGPGDSVLITITVADTSKVVFELSPGGLQFKSTNPAKLTLHYAQADHDFDQDGDTDLFDLLTELQLAMWRQGSSGLPFLKITSLLETLFDRVSANLTGFSQYAVAY
jgi:hypothetical protein